jgi:hypothetical protein
MKTEKEITEFFLFFITIVYFVIYVDPYQINSSFHSFVDN